MTLVSPSDPPSSLFDVTSRKGRNRATRLVSVRLPEGLLRELAAVGNENGTTMSETIRRALERGLGSAKSTKSARKKKKKE
jgi:metal-responsive CopG/Arc/MetJ family transcriptional regulator